MQHALKSDMWLKQF